MNLVRWMGRNRLVERRASCAAKSGEAAAWETGVIGLEVTSVEARKRAGTCPDDIKRMGLLVIPRQINALQNIPVESMNRDTPAASSCHQSMPR